MQVLNKEEVTQVSGAMSESDGLAALGVVAGAGVIAAAAPFAAGAVLCGVIGICGLDIWRHIERF
ncbi:MAG: hypothetical protein ACRD22_08680 [Terriglobia bacterium]